MKTKLKILNFVLWLLGLTTEKTGLVDVRGKKFTLKNFEYQFYTNKELSYSMMNKEALSLLENRLFSAISNHGIVEFKHQTFSKTYGGKKEKHYSCKASVTFLTVLK